MTDLPEVFGAVLRSHREKKGWSQMKLAMKAGLHLNALGNLERGNRSPSLYTVLLIAKALEIRASELIAEVEKSRPKL